jgi:hypothetical protein
MPIPIPCHTNFQPVFSLDDFWAIFGRNKMSDNPTSIPAQTNFGELADRYPPKLARKLKLLLPLKSHIEGLLAKRASYDDIRTLLKQANIIVSKNTVYRFCHEVIGRQPIRRRGGDRNENAKVLPPASPPSSSTSIQSSLQERRERVPGLWGRRKRGPRIADSKNL